MLRVLYNYPAAFGLLDALWTSYSNISDIATLITATPKSYIYHLDCNHNEVERSFGNVTRKTLARKPPPATTQPYPTPSTKTQNVP